jgi:hypothetical protein
MTPDLIPLTKFPTIPAPLQSSDAGESWVWGNFVLILQKNPITLAEVFNAMSPQKTFQPPPVQYPYAMSVFYRPDKNPHGQSKCPVMVSTLERMDYAKVRERMLQMGMLKKTPVSGSDSNSPTVFGVFNSNSRKNLGNFEGELTLESVRNDFFQIIGRELALDGEPKRIGVIKDIYGHPDTGWPSEKEATSSATNKNTKGCLSVIAIGGLMAASILVFLIQKI